VATGIFSGCSVFAGAIRGVGFDPSYSRSDGHERPDPHHPGLLFGEIRGTQGGLHLQPAHAGTRAGSDGSARPRPPFDRGRDATPVFIEVPNAARIFDECFVWDIIYEHTSYFTRGSLATTLARSGFGGVVVDEAFHGQFLTAFARAADGGRQGPVMVQAETRGQGRTIGGAIRRRLFGNHRALGAPSRQAQGIRKNDGDLGRGVEGDHVSEQFRHPGRRGVRGGHQSP